MAISKKITTFLWFDGQAEEAAHFYTSIFEGSRITSKSPGPGGKPMTVAFELNGQSYVALNGGPQFKFNESVSLMIACDTQEDIDALWSKLLEGGGTEGQCGWLKDRFGLSWQVVPSGLGALMSGPAAPRVVAAFMKMKKFNLAELQRAADGS